MIARYDQTGNMGDVRHEIGVHAFGDLAHSSKINHAGISGSAADDELRAHSLSQLGNFFIVQQTRFRTDAVLVRLVQLPRKALRIGMAQMTASIKTHAHDLIARFQDGGINGHVGLCAAVRLHVDVPFLRIQPEHLQSTGAGDLLNLVYILTAAIVAVAGIALSIFGGEYAAHGRDDGGGGIVFRGNHFQMAHLAFILFGDEAKDFLIASRVKAAFGGIGNRHQSSVL